MAISAWLGKGRIHIEVLMEVRKSIIHLSKKHPKHFAVYWSFTTFVLMGKHTP
jgi:hypothetical protein